MDNIHIFHQCFQPIEEYRFIKWITKSIQFCIKLSSDLRQCSNCDRQHTDSIEELRSQSMNLNLTVLVAIINGGKQIKVQHCITCRKRTSRKRRRHNLHLMPLTQKLLRHLTHMSLDPTNKRIIILSNQ